MKTFKEFLKERDTKYSFKNLNTDIEKLKNLFENKFYGNVKLISQLKKIKTKLTPYSEEWLDVKKSILWEEDQFNQIVKKSNIGESNNEKILNITKWIANNGIDPDKHFAPNAEFRWNHILEKIGFNEEWIKYENV